MPERLRYDEQEQLYAFPYHHIPHLQQGGGAARIRRLRWGFEYLCYLYAFRTRIHELGPSSILDVGCGDGRLLGLVDASVVERRVGVDLSERAIAFAKAFHPEVEFLATDAETLTESFDLVTAMEVLEHVPDDDVSRFLQTLAARTRPGGSVLISVPTKVIPLNPKHHRHYDLPLFRAQLASAKADLEITDVRYAYRDSSLVDWYVRLTDNRWWTATIHRAERAVWRYVVNRLSRASERDGRHLLVLLRRSGAAPND